MALSFYSVKWSPHPVARVEVNAPRGGTTSPVPERGVWRYQGDGGECAQGFYDMQDCTSRGTLHLPLGAGRTVRVNIDPDTARVTGASLRIGVGLLPSTTNMLDTLLDEPSTAQFTARLLETEPDLAQAMRDERNQYVVFVPPPMSPGSRDVLNVRGYIVHFPTAEVAHNYHALCLPGQRAQRGDPYIHTMTGATMRVVDWTEERFNVATLEPRGVPTISPQKPGRSTMPYHVIRKLQITQGISVNVHLVRVAANGIIYSANVNFPR